MLSLSEHSFKERLSYIITALLLAAALIIGFFGGDSADLSGNLRSRGSRVRFAPPTPSYTLPQNNIQNPAQNSIQGQSIYNSAPGNNYEPSDGNFSWPADNLNGFSWPADN